MGLGEVAVQRHPRHSLHEGLVVSVCVCVFPCICEFGWQYEDFKLMTRVLLLLSGPEGVHAGVLKAFLKHRHCMETNTSPTQQHHGGAHSQDFQPKRPYICELGKLYF